VTDRAAPAVIVADEEAQIVELVVRALENDGIAALGCTNASEAFWFIGRYQPSLIILDVQMPGLDGVHFFEHLRADPSRADTNVMFLAANPEFLQRALPDYARRGAILVAKPVQVLELVDLVAAALSGGMEISRRDLRRS
jgi:two-component system, OmpR family, response regulator AdeR